MQQITLYGNLTADATVLVDQMGKEFISFKLAVNDSRKGERLATFYDITAPKTGVLEYLRKGQGVVLSGPLNLSLIEKDGRTFMNARVFARELELASGAGGSRRPE